MQGDTRLQCGVGEAPSSGLISFQIVQSFLRTRQKEKQAPGGMSVTCAGAVGVGGDSGEIGNIRK